MKERNAVISVKAKNTMLAVESAARTLGVGISQVRYEVVAESRGFLGLIGRSVEIRASVMSCDRGDSKRRQGASRRDGDGSRRRGRDVVRSMDAERADRDDSDESSSREPARPLTERETADLVEELRGFFAGVAERIVGQPVTVTAEVEEGRLALDADSEELADQITRHPKLAEAFESVVRKKPRHLKQELPFRVFVDACSTRRGHERELVQMAREMSEKVFQDRRPIVLPNRCAYDRKIIHMTLDKDSRVYTKSVGSGNSRKLMILPRREDSAEA